MTTGAATLWKQASSATTEVIDLIVKGENEEDYRFPRPPGSTSNSNNNATKPPPAHESGRQPAVNEKQPPYTHLPDRYTNQQPSSSPCLSSTNSNLSSLATSGNNSWDSLSDVLGSLKASTEQDPFENNGGFTSSTSSRKAVSSSSSTRKTPKKSGTGLVVTGVTDDSTINQDLDQRVEGLSIKNPNTLASNHSRSSLNSMGSSGDRLSDLTGNGGNNSNNAVSVLSSPSPVQRDTSSQSGRVSAPLSSKKGGSTPGSGDDFFSNFGL